MRFTKRDMLYYSSMSSAEPHWPWLIKRPRSFDASLYGRSFRERRICWPRHFDGDANALADTSALLFRADIVLRAHMAHRKSHGRMRHWPFSHHEDRPHIAHDIIASQKCKRGLPASTTFLTTAAIITTTDAISRGAPGYRALRRTPAYSSFKQDTSGYFAYTSTFIAAP